MGKLKSAAAIGSLLVVALTVCAQLPTPPPGAARRPSSYGHFYNRPQRPGSIGRRNPQQAVFDPYNNPNANPFQKSTKSADTHSHYYTYARPALEQRAQTQRRVDEGLKMVTGRGPDAPNIGGPTRRTSYHGHFYDAPGRNPRAR